MNFHFSPAAPGRATLLALHGRGGGERQLLALCRAADRSLGILAPRGEVSSPPGHAWSRRHAPGMPCLRDLRERATALGCWLDGALVGLGVAPPLVVVGYSNGAIMGVALAGLRPDLVGALALLRGSYPLPGLLGEGVLRGTAMLASEGENDQLLSAGASAAGARLLCFAGARVQTVRHRGAGHGLCLADGRELRRWLSQPASTRQAELPERRGAAR